MFKSESFYPLPYPFRFQALAFFSAKTFEISEPLATSYPLKFDRCRAQNEDSLKLRFRIFKPLK